MLQFRYGETKDIVDFVVLVDGYTFQLGWLEHRKRLWYSHIRGEQMDSLPLSSRKGYKDRTSAEKLLVKRLLSKGGHDPFESHNQSLAREGNR